MAATTRRARATAVALALGVAAGGAALGLGTASAQAADTARAAAPAKPYVTVDTGSSAELFIRHYPSTDSTIRGSLHNGDQRGVDCKVRAQNIAGDTVWYKLRGKEQWVSGKWAKPTGTVKYCNEVYPSDHRVAATNGVG
ncbi:hypothetical protein AAHZ94_08045 [Streptomyces sp. HSW2009]|uniref:hypothetical protein n=1 Tax=Streptomyces sp. HSW2009 TaxID=3142890 RepID=UPI0032EEF40A